MASKYLRATGDWYDPDSWSDTVGGIGGDGAPSELDSVYLDANFTVSLTDNAAALEVRHSNGRLNLSSYKLTLGNSSIGAGYLGSTGSTARTLDLGSGTLHIVGRYDDSGAIMSLSGSNLTLIAGNSIVIMDAIGHDGVDIYENYLELGNNTLNDVRVNMGVGIAQPATLNITGSPTFRTLDIRSANSAAHTVNFDGDITLAKLVALGSSSAGRLTLRRGDNNPDLYANFKFTDDGSSYGQYVVTDSLEAERATGPEDEPPLFPVYIGANSVQGTWASLNFIFQDPPKISTLVDPLTTAPGSNSNWVFSDPGSTDQGSFGIGGGGYIMSGYAASFDTFDIIDSSVTVEGHVSVSSVILAINSIPASGLYAFIGTSSDNSSNGAYQFQPYRDTLANSNTGIISFGRISLSSSTRILKIEGSLDGVAWSTYFSSSPIPADQIPYYRSLGIALLGSPGSVNMLPAPQASGNFFAFF